MANDVVILGFGPAAASAVEALRSQGCDANVDIITAGPAFCESPVLTSYNAAGIVTREQGSIYASALDDANVRIFPNEEITSIDTESQTVKAASGRRVVLFRLPDSHGRITRAFGRKPTFRMQSAYASNFRRCRASERDACRAPPCQHPHLRDLHGRPQGGGGVHPQGWAANHSGSQPSYTQRVGASPCGFQDGSSARRPGNRASAWRDCRKSRVLEDGSTSVSFSHQEEPRVFDAVLVAHGMSPNIDFIETPAYMPIGESSSMPSCARAPLMSMRREMWPQCPACLEEARWPGFGSRHVSRVR